MNREDNGFEDAFERFDESLKRLQKNIGDSSSGKDEIFNFSEEEYEFIINTYLDRNNIAFASIAAHQAIEKFPFSSDIVVRVIDVYIADNELKKAEALLNKYTNSFLINSDISLCFCRLNIHKNHFEEAKKYFNKALTLESFPEDLCDSVSLLAQDCMEMRNYEEALAYFKEALKLLIKWNTNNNKKEKQETLENFYINIAYCYDNIGKDTEAIRFYNKYLDLNPFNDDAWVLLGTIQSRIADIDNAKQSFEYALSINNNNHVALFNLGLLCLNFADVKGAISYFTDFCNIQKNNIAGTVALANSYLAANNINQAEQLFNRAINIDNNNVNAQLGLTYVNAIKAFNNGEKQKFMSYIKIIDKQDSRWLDTLIAIVPTDFLTDEEFASYLKNRNNNRNEK